MRKPKFTLARMALLAALACPALPGLAEDGKPLRPRPRFEVSSEEALGTGRDARTLILKLEDGARTASKAAPSTALEAARTQGARVEPLFTLPPPLLEALRRTGEQRTGQALSDLSRFYVLHLPDAAAGKTLLADLLTLPGVETAYAHRPTRGPVDKPPTTPNFTNALPGQGYRDPAPAGIDVLSAWERGFDGTGVTIADVERGWNLAHEDLDHLLGQTPAVPLIPQALWAPAAQADVDHGTATLGVLAAGDNGYGTTGLVPGARIHVAPLSLAGNPSWIGPNAVVLATLALRPGDVLLLEAEIPIGPSAAVPFETDPAEYAAVRQATALGIHVIEPAGNSSGGLDLNTHPSVRTAGGSSKFDRYVRDSGAVLVGGGRSAVSTSGPLARPYHARYPNSNYGSRVDTYAWGQNVTTLGYGPRSSTLAFCNNSGNPFPISPADPDQQYTYCYNGTSAAGAIVAGAAAVLEQKHRQAFGQSATPRELRNLLSLGTLSDGVGHQPDLAYQLDFLEQGGVIAHLFEAEYEVAGGHVGARFGATVAGGGDVDGDGVPDVAVGQPDFTVNLGGGGFLFQAGRVYVFSGADGSLLYRLDGQASEDHFGAAVALGDADANGLADLAVGAPGVDLALGLDAGAVQLFRGRDGSLLTTFQGAASGEAYGSAVAFAGNVNPPGSGHARGEEPFDDLIIGAPGGSRAEVVNLLGQSLAVLSDPTQPSCEFGFAVAGAGDLDRDGAADLLTGAPAYVHRGQSAGAVFAWSGATGAQLFRRTGNEAGPVLGAPRYGESVAGAGDVDADGWLEVVVGAPNHTLAPGGSFGRAELLDRDGQFLAGWNGSHPRDRLGTAVAGAGDFDGDGLADVAVGSPSLVATFLTTRTGRVHLYLGDRNARAVGTRQRLFETQDYDTLWGQALAAAGDVNGDGRADLLTGEPGGEDGGRAFVFTAGPGPDHAAGQARLVADLPVIEAHDVDGNTFGGGGTSPSRSIFTLDAGTAWAGADYAVVGIPDVGPYLTGGLGQLDAAGRTSTPVFGPIESVYLCQLIGTRFSFVGAALLDQDGDGLWDVFQLSNFAEVEIMNEYAPLCR